MRIRNNKRDRKNTISVDEKINRQSINKGYVLLYLAVLLAAVGFGFISYFVFHETLADILKDTVGNLVGVLTAFLIFDIINDKLQKDSYSKEMSKSILEAIMAKPETLGSFTQEQRNAFILSTVKASVADPDCAEMISDQCLTFLSNGNYDAIRLAFDYKFELYENLPSACGFLSSPSDYYYVQEILGYTIRLFCEDSYSRNDRIHIGFLFNNKAIDDSFHTLSASTEFNHCIFRENLDMKPEDIAYLRALPPEAFRDTVNRMIKFDLQIDQEPGELVNIELRETGILFTFGMHIPQRAEHNVRIIFHMPKAYGTLLQVVISDPTKAPNITVSYPEDKMEVDMYAYLSKGKESSYEIAHEKKNGIYDIALNTEWIYPISGLVFFPEKRN